jgi:uncharacterized lipoprotein YddW (UPF0748 family)
VKKREFIRILGVGSAGLVVNGLIPKPSLLFAADGQQKRKNWTWVTTDIEPSDDEWKRRFALMRQSGIDAVLPEVFDGYKAYYGSNHLPVAEGWLEKLLPLAKAEGLEVHAWIWSMPCMIDEVRQRHLEWFVVNRKGESAAEKPAYVDSYKFLCPSRPEVHEFIKATVSELSAYGELDGIHLDYIRYPDVILPEALQPKYHIKQDREYPEYDYCYCDVCVGMFREETGIDILKMEDPATSTPWRQFRYDRITHLVNDTVIPVAHGQKKLVTAAVFPNWELVRQEWPVWNLDAVLPMLYHRLYGKDTVWIREQTERGVSSLRNRRPLYSGLLVFHLSPDEMGQAVEAALDGGASGVVIFPAQGMSESHWRRFSETVRG